MLDKLLLGLLLIAPQTNLYAGQKIQTQQIDSHDSSEDLSQKLLNEANKRAAVNLYSAIPYYRRLIIEGGPLKEEAIKRAGEIYGKLAFRFEPNKSDLEIALNFYNEIIEKHKDSSFLSEAYLNSGKLLCCIADPKNVEDGMRRLKIAYELAKDNKIKVDAYFLLGLVEMDHAIVGYKQFNFENARKYFERIIELMPGSKIAEESQKILNRISPKKIN